MRPLTPEGYGCYPTGAVSPDGKWVWCFETRAGGKNVLYPVDGGLPRVLNDFGADEGLIRWDATGKALLYEKGYPNGKPVAIYRYELATGKREFLKKTEERISPFEFELTPDGQSYAYSYHHGLSTLFVVDGLR